MRRLLTRRTGRGRWYWLPRLSISRILAWADAHHARTGEWPNAKTGRVVDAPDESWVRISQCLIHGHRGLPGGSSLARLLADERGLRNVKGLPPLSIGQILGWADAHHARTGEWPRQTSGDVPEAPGENWRNIQNSLVRGQRGLPANTTVAEILREHRGIRNSQNLPHFTKSQILRWADAHRKRAGQWPTRSTGDVVDAPGEKWANVDQALSKGLRGLPGGDSLAQLLARCRGHRNIMELPHLTVKLVLEWADAHFERTGKWPSQHSGLVIDARGEKWKNIHTALVLGQRGLPGGDTLARVLDRYRAAKRQTGRPTPP